MDKSPIVWRELVDQGGQGSLIGGADDFQEYVAAYYNVYSSLTTEVMLEIAEDNTRFKQAEVAEKIEAVVQRVTPSKIVVVGACSKAATYLLPYLATHGIFDPKERVALHLYDDPEQVEVLRSIEEDLQDLAAPMLAEIKVVTELADSLSDAKQIIFLNVVPRLQIGCEEVSTSHTKTTTTTPDLRKFEAREVWLQRRYAFFKAIGLLIKTHCPSSVRILVTGNPGLDADSINSPSPVNFDVAVLHQVTAPQIPPKQIAGLVGSIEQRIKATLATNLRVSSHDITDVVVWGNIGGKTFIDLSRSRVYRRRASDVGIVAGSWFSIPTLEAARDLDWFNNEMQVEVFKKRTKAITDYIGLSHAQAVIRLLNGWWNGMVDDKERIHSLVVASEDWYGVPRGIVFSFPVTRCPKSCWSVVEDMEVSTNAMTEIEACIKNVLEDWAVIDPEPLRNYMGGRKDISKPEDFIEMESEE
ncbi:putative Malate dehydrogenase [Paragonimus heterotremus]|uniref:Putative Malate dehydrogenase n=1 Tax=Paragonimus heterotremus TaxID=100268 RepID=A0A8J4WP99_9TREM|nr:putative Malate dehydrogenase [Paragonimus heterotremus]